MIINPIIRTSLAFIGLLVISISSYAVNINDTLKQHKRTSSRDEAARFINAINTLDSSTHWPGINPVLFLKNVKVNVNKPVTIYPGEGSYFCGYSALTYLILQEDPLGYAQFVLSLYQQGKAVYKGVEYTPSNAVKAEAGRFKFKGVMDIHPADQMWFLTLADHYKGYLNLFNRRYQPGDENSFWASVNFAKLNRMAKKMLPYAIKAKGADILHPCIKDLYSYIKDGRENGEVILYINNRIVHKKNHTKIKVSVPTHFIVVENIQRDKDVITLIYWDNGAKTLLQLTPAFLKRIVYGVTLLTNDNNAN